ncbi:MAG: heat-inducible transcription repressor HrcA [Oscillibacter sp.]|nr:heat-inducible transcription repressor HrcA [Oscillibacter sp.]
MELSDRKKRILKVVVEDYVRTAEPVGSKAIAAKLGGRVSSATIRSELAALTELGCLEQPHTSAGRVPTPQGYRLYVDELMEQRALSVRETERLQSALQIRVEELDRVIARAGQALSAFVNYPSYVTAAGREPLTVRRFDLLPVDEGSCIVVLMLSTSRVKSQLLRYPMALDSGELPVLSNLLNAHFAGLSPQDMAARLMEMPAQLPPAAFLLLNQIVDYASDKVEEQQRRIVTAGAAELLKLPEFQDPDRAHALMSVLDSEKDSLPALSEDGGPMQILIGPENAADALKDTSVVIASYDIGDDMRGLVGVVGPTRMDYAAVAARLAGFADGLTRLFGKPKLPTKEDAES